MKTLHDIVARVFAGDPIKHAQAIRIIDRVHQRYFGGEQNAGAVTKPREPGGQHPGASTSTPAVVANTERKED